MVSGLEISAGALAFIDFLAKFEARLEEFCMVDERCQSTRDTLRRLSTFVHILEIVHSESVIHRLVTNKEDLLLTDETMETLAALIEAINKTLVVGEKLTSAFQLEGPGVAKKLKRNGRKAWKVIGGVGTAKMGSFMDYSQQIGLFLNEIHLLISIASPVLDKDAPRAYGPKSTHKAISRIGKSAAQAYGIKATGEFYQQLVEGDEALGNYYMARIERDAVMKTTTLCTALPQELPTEVTFGHGSSSTEASLKLEAGFTHDTKPEGAEKTKRKVPLDSTTRLEEELEWQDTPDPTNKTAEKLETKAIQESKTMEVKEVSRKFPLEMDIERLTTAITEARLSNILRIGPTASRIYRCK